MTDALFFLLFACPLVLLALYRDGEGMNVLKVGCANTLMLFYVIADHIGLLWLHFSQNGLAQLSVVRQDTVLLLAAYSNVVVLAYILTGLASGPHGSYVRVPDIGRLRSEEYRTRFIVLLAVFALPLSIAKVLDDSPLLLLLSGDPRGAAVARVTDVSTNRWFLGIKPSYVDIAFGVLYYGSYVALVMLFARKQWRYFWLWLCAFLPVGLNYFANTAKGFIALPAMACWVVYSLVQRRGHLFNRALIWIGVFTMVGVSAFSAWVLGNESAEVLAPIERLVVGNLLPQYAVVNAFGFDNLLMGASVPSWFSLNLHHQFLLDVFAWRELMGEYTAFFYTAPSSFVAEAHANFHVYGVVVASLFLFGCLRVADVALRRIRSEITYVALTAFTAIYFSVIARSGMIAYIIDYNLWAVLLFAFLSHRFVLSRATSKSADRGNEPAGGGGSTS